MFVFLLAAPSGRAPQTSFPPLRVAQHTGLPGTSLWQMQCMRTLLVISRPNPFNVLELKFSKPGDGWNWTQTLSFCTAEFRVMRGLHGKNFWVKAWERLGLFMSVEDEVQICTIPLHISSAPLACLMPDVPLPFLNSWQGQAKMRWASFHPLWTSLHTEGSSLSHPWDGSENTSMGQVWAQHTLHPLLPNHRLSEPESLRALSPWYSPLKHPSSSTSSPSDSPSSAGILTWKICLLPLNLQW